MKKTDIEKITPKEAVRLLELVPFIEDNKTHIYSRLEQCNSMISDQEKDNRINQRDGDMMFITQCLPLISGIVQVGSNLKAYQKAITMVRSKNPECAPVAVLSALTFIYIIERAHEELCSISNENRAVWDEIKRRTKRI